MHKPFTHGNRGLKDLEVYRYNNYGIVRRAGEGLISDLGVGNA